VGQLSEKLLDYLKAKRDDGNKVYLVKSIAAECGGEPLDATTQASDIFSAGDDAFAIVSVDVDAKRHVKPIASASVA